MNINVIKQFRNRDINGNTLYTLFIFENEYKVVNNEKKYWCNLGESFTDDFDIIADKTVCNAIIGKIKEYYTSNKVQLLEIQNKQGGIKTCIK